MKATKEWHAQLELWHGIACTCKPPYAHTHRHLYMHTCCTHVYMHKGVHECIRACMHACTCARMWRARVNACTHICTAAHTQHTQAHACTHARMHARTHARTHAPDARMRARTQTTHAPIACMHTYACMKAGTHTFFYLTLPASVRDVQHDEVDDHKECEHNEANQYITGKQIARACPRLSSQIWPLSNVHV